MDRIDRKKREIRLLRIEAGDDENPIACTTEKAALDKHLEFDATVIWEGRSEHTKPSRIDQTQVHVTVNMESGMRRLRSVHRRDPSGLMSSVSTRTIWMRKITQSP
jgi:hypothetical protein